MGNILTDLRAWYESFLGKGYTHAEFKDLYYTKPDGSIKIHYYDVEDIVNGYFGTCDQCMELSEILSERDDYIRLLRAENQKLRGVN